MNDAPPPTPPHQLASDSQGHLRVLDELIDISADLMHMIHAEVRQAVESATPSADPTAPPPPPAPWPMISENPIDAVNDLARSIRLSAALANTLKPPAPPPESHQRILNHVIDVSVDLSRIIHAEVRRAVNATEPSTPPPTWSPFDPPPVEPAPIAKDPIRAVNELARSARLTIALFEKLKRPPKLPAAPRQPNQSRPAQDRNKDHDRRGGKEVEATEDETEAERNEALAEAIYRPVAQIIAGLGRAAGIEKFHDNHPWKQRFLKQLPALIHQAALQAATPDSQPTEAETPDPHPPHIPNFATPPPDF